MTKDIFEINGLKVKRGERGFTRLPVTSLLVGSELGIPLHVIHGAQPGPVLGMIGVIHGIEHFPIRIQREVMLGIDPAHLAGTLLAIPVANPMAFARAKRSTPEEDVDFGNMNRIFPGRRAKPAFGEGESPASDVSMTEIMASVLTEQFFPRLNYLIDFHCHWNKGGLFMMLQDIDDGSETTRRSHDMTRYFNLGMVNENAPAGTKTATGYAHSLGVATACVEVGGGALSEPVARKAVRIGADGVLNIMRHLHMIPGDPVEPRRQLSAHIRPHVRPTKAGYLLTRCEPEDLFRDNTLGIPVKKGEIVAEVYDPYTFQVVEEIKSPVDGIVYMTRASGPVEAGAHGFSIADTTQARWIE